MPRKSEVMRWGGYKCRTLEMNLKLRNQQLKTIPYIYIYDIYCKPKNYNWNKKQIRKINNIKDSHQTTRGEKKRRKMSNKKKSEAINKMAIRTCTSITTLNVNILNSPTKRHRLAEWIQKEDLHIYAVLKRPTSLLGTHTNWKWEGGRKYSMQMGIKIKLE